MGRLTNLPSRIGGLPSRIARHTDPEGHSRAETWRAWYGTARWKRLRADVLRRDLYTCQCGCGHVEPDTSLLVADHVKDHHGDPDLFWDPGNLQTLWRPHHDSWKQSRAKRFKR
ncbi:MAG: hypothetical protein U1C74_21590 [Phenylobacterium sp.]|nr:hypothetical protein [Phenylobacterium sp.]